MKYERSFLVKKLPDDIKNYEVLYLEQWYIDDLRIRRYSDGRCYIDCKSKNISIKDNSIKEYIKDKPSIKSKRFYKKMDNYKIIVEIFLTIGITTVEIESKDNNIQEVQLPEWFGEEVTNNPKYDTKFLYKKLIYN